MSPKTERFEMRLDPEALAKIDGWRRHQPDMPSRAEAIRRLVDMGLKLAAAAARLREAKAAARAKRKAK